MNLLLTNDDGIDAPGIAALGKLAASLGNAIWAAPHEHLSGCSHRVTTGCPVRVVKRDERRFAIEGTPADCVRVGLAHLAPQTDWVLSGINEGGNLGADVHISGTVAAVREAVLHGKPGIALSHYRKRQMEIDWDRAVVWLQPVLADLLRRPWEPGTFWNINVPNVEEGEPEPRVVYCPVDPNPLPLSYRIEDDRFHYNGNYHQRVRHPGTDVDVCFSGNIAVSLVRLF